MDVLHRFLIATFKPFFLGTGAATALIGLYAFLPEWSVSQLAQIRVPAQLHHHRSALGDHGWLDGAIHDGSSHRASLAVAYPRFQWN
jgi:hypothetical protein